MSCLAPVLNIMLDLEESFVGSECWILPSVVDKATVTNSARSSYLRQGRG